MSYYMMIKIRITNMKVIDKLRGTGWWDVLKLIYLLIVQSL